MVAIKGNECSIFRIFEESDAYVFIVKAIIMNFSEDWDVGILYLATKFELDQFTNNGNLLSDRKHWKHKHTHTNTDWIWYSPNIPYQGRVKKKKYTRTTKSWDFKCFCSDPLNSQNIYNNICEWLFVGWPVLSTSYVQYLVIMTSVQHYHQWLTTLHGHASSLPLVCQRHNCILVLF